MPDAILDVVVTGQRHLIELGAALVVGVVDGHEVHGGVRPVLSCRYLGEDAHVGDLERATLAAEPARAHQVALQQGVIDRAHSSPISSDSSAGSWSRNQ